MARRAKHWTLREDYRPLLIKVKKLFPTVLAHVKTKRVALVGLEGRSASFMARIYSNRYPWSLLTEQYDYLIVFWSTRFDTKKRSYKCYVMLHELAHVLEHGFVKGHPEYRKLRKHDVENFKDLIEVYGLRLQRVKDVMKGEEVLLRNTSGKEAPKGPKIA